ncbi:microtubule-associated protein 9 [Pristis pectinata]|uniref:microtubule-associated protein 9 n=1 Tax=Pristis pectinata TaxID=685728 RepID=UPI00223DB888|nr:microtubule-associated protein 9 [Pristis pectinata]
MSEEDFRTTPACARSPIVSKRTMFQDELHRTVAARVMKQFTIEENAFSDFDYENEKPRSLMKNRRNNDDELDNLTITEKPVEHHHSNDQWSPVSFLKSTKSNMREYEENVPVPKPRECKMRLLPSTEKVKNSLADESPKPKPRYNLLKKQSDSAWANELEKQDDNLFNTCHSTSYSKLSTTINKNKSYSRSPCSEYPRSSSYLSKASSLNMSRSTSSIPDVRCADSIEAQMNSSADDNPTGSIAIGRINGKKSCITAEQIQDNANELNINKSEYFLQEEADVDNWQSLMCKPNLEQCVTDYAISESFMENSLKLKEKAQAKMKWIGIKSQNPETNAKSKSSRSLNSPLEILERSSVGKNTQSNTTESRYLGTLKILDVKAFTNETSNLEAADTIRASIYQEWLERKRQILHEDKKHRKLKAQQENEKREQKSIENKKEVKASFEAWKAKKKNAFKEICQKKKEEEKIKQQAEAEKEVRKEEAEKVFEKWKEGKNRYLKEKLQKQKQVQKEKGEKEKEQVAERKKENALAFMKWNEKKEIVVKQRMKEIAKDQQKKKREEEYTKSGREEMAALEYEKWLAQKEKNEKKQKKIKSALYRDPPPPWSPPNKTIPFGK